jgi:hypothetical protein
MEDRQNVAANNLWAELRQWMKNNCFAQNLTVSEVSPNELHIKTRQGRQLCLNFIPGMRASLGYKLGAGVQQEVQLSVTIRGAAFFGFAGERHSAEDLGVKLLYELTSEKT